MEMSCNERNLGSRHLKSDSTTTSGLHVYSQTVDERKGKNRSCLECYQILRGRNLWGAGVLEAFTKLNGTVDQ